MTTVFSIECREEANHFTWIMLVSFISEFEKYSDPLCALIHREYVEQCIEKKKRRQAHKRTTIAVTFLSHHTLHFSVVTFSAALYCCYALQRAASNCCHHITNTFCNTNRTYLCWRWLGSTHRVLYCQYATRWTFHHIRPPFILYIFNGTIISEKKLFFYSLDSV